MKKNSKIEKFSDMTPYYEDVCTQFNWPKDENLIQTMRKNNEATKKELEDKTEDAVKNLGSTEVRESYLKRAEFFTRIGDKVWSLMHCAELLLLQMCND
jgi:26S proteasome regulatory subunit N7